LIFAEPVIVIDSSVEFPAERKTRIKIVPDRKASGVDVPVDSLDSEDACACVPGEEKSEVPDDSCLV